MKKTGRSLMQAIVVICILSIVAMLGWKPVTNAQIEKEPGTDQIEKFTNTDNPDISIIDVSKFGFVDASGANKHPVPMGVPSASDLGEESEPNDSIATADVLAATAGRIKGYAVPGTPDVDYYSFNATAGDRIYAAVMTSFSPGSVNSILDLRDSTDAIVETDLDDGTFGTTSSTIAGRTITSTGTYYLRVRENATSTIRPYYLYFAVKSGSPVAETEPNNDTANADPLGPTNWMSGTVDPAADVDFYSVSLAAGDTVFLSLDLDPERDNVQFNGRLGFGLFGTGNTLILLANDASVGTAANPLSEAFFFTVKDAGTYFIYVDEAAAGGAATNTYNMGATVIPAASSAGCTTFTQSTPTPIADLALSSSTLVVSGITGRIRDVNVFLDATHTFMVDTDWHLRSPNGGGNDNGIITDVGAGTTGGPQTSMNLRLDDEAGIPPAFTLSATMTHMPELSYRLDWFDGEDPNGIWTLDIRDDAAVDTGTLNSWSLQICEEPAAGPTETIYSQDFEASDGGFTHSGTLDEWERGTPATAATSVSPARAAFLTCNSGTNCWKTDLDATYEASSTMDLVSPSIPIPAGSTNVMASWAMRYQLESATFDHAWVDVREVGNPTNAKRVWQWYGATMSSGVGNPTVQIGESAGWGIYKGDISSFAGMNIEIVFHVDGDSTVHYPGMAIDDVQITRTPAAGSQADLSVTKTDSPDPVAPGENITYTINFANSGPNAAETVTVTDAVPANTSFVSAAVTTGTGWTITSPPVGGTGNVIFSKGTVANGETAVFSVVVNVNPGTPNGTVVSNTATAASTTTDPTPGNNTSTANTTVQAAVPVNVSGRVTTGAGRGISGVRVLLTEENADTRIAYTNSFGYYQLFDVLTQQDITLTPTAKRYTFVPNTFKLTGPTTVNFVGIPD